MAIKIPTRNYLTFSELQERWKCSENDLRYAIISAELKPCVRLIGKHRVVMWERGFLDEWVASDYQRPEEDYVLETDVRGWQYLQDPIQTESFDCEFRFAADERMPLKEEFPFAIWRRLNTPITIRQVKESAVFLLEEVATYEAKYGNESEYRKAEKPQSNRERNTLLTIIATLCVEAKIPYEKPAKAAGMIQSTAAKLGVAIGETTIEGHLKKIPDALATRMK
ncbi:MAG: hypothetical protein V4454_03415 [Pseudomonadota bacterium]